MSDYRILESDRLEMRSQRRRIMLMLGSALLLSAILFSIPVVRDYRAKREAQATARKLALLLSSLKTQAMLKKTAIEAKFVEPDVIEVYEAPSCAANAERTKMSTQTLTDWRDGVIFVGEQWVHKNTDWKDHVLSRFCYDPMNGSSLKLDGYSSGTIFLADRAVFKRNYPFPQDENASDFIAEIEVVGETGDLKLD